MHASIHRCAYLLTLMMVAPVAAIPPFRTVALSGQRAANTPSGVLYDSFTLPYVDAFGRVSFAASLIGTGIGPANDTGVWSEVPGSLSLIAREGAPAPGQSMLIGANFDDLILHTTFAYGPGGHFAFNAKLTDGNTTADTDTGLWVYNTMTLRMILREGDDAPGALAHTVFDDVYVDEPIVGRNGFVAFVRSLRGPSVNMDNDESLWVDRNGSLLQLAREDNSAAGLSPGIKYEHFGTPAVAGNGVVAFLSSIKGSGITTANDSCLWSTRTGSLALAVREGAQAPGLPTGVLFGDMATQASVNDLGESIIANILTGTGVMDENKYSLWAEVNGVLTLLARGMDPAPGTPMDVSFYSFGSPVMNSARQYAFYSYLQGTSMNPANWFGHWSSGSGVLGKVFRMGDQAAGTDPGVVYSGGNNPLLNAVGQVAFAAPLTGGSSTPTDNFGIWLQEPSGDVLLIVRKGDMLEVAPGDLRTISLLEGPVLNDIGQLAFKAEFTDGSSGLFVTIGPDADNDGINDGIDNCPGLANSNQADADKDGTGDLCDACPNDRRKTEPGACGCGTPEGDVDADGVPNCFDNCLTVANADQADTDGDGIGDTCDETMLDDVPMNPDIQGTPMPPCCAAGTVQTMVILSPALLLGRRVRTEGRHKPLSRRKHSTVLDVT